MTVESLVSHFDLILVLLSLHFLGQVILVLLPKTLLEVLVVVLEHHLLLVDFVVQVRVLVHVVIWTLIHYVL